MLLETEIIALHSFIALKAGANLNIFQTCLRSDIDEKWNVNVRILILNLTNLIQYLLTNLVTDHYKLYKTSSSRITRITRISD